MIDSARKQTEDQIGQLRQLATAEGVFALFKLEAQGIKNRGLVQLVDTDDIWSLRVAAFLSLYQVARNMDKPLGEAFQIVWQACLRMRMLDDTQLPKYAGWVAHYERGEVVTHRCTKCQSLFASSIDNLANDCVIHR